MSDLQNGAVQQAPASWDDQISEMRDLGLKYMNGAMNAASGQGGGITRNTFQFASPAATAGTSPSLSASAGAPASFLSSPVFKGLLLGLGGPALLAAGSLLPGLLGKAGTPTNTPQPPAVTTPLERDEAVSFGIDKDGHLVQDEGGAK